MNVGTSGDGECAYASFASPPYISRFSFAAIARNKRWIGCSTHDEYVLTSACRRGAARLDPSQHCRARQVPSHLTRYCQWDRSTIETGSFGLSVGSPNISRSLNWSNWRRSPASHSSQVGHVFNFRRVKVPRACSSGVILLDVNE